MNDDGPGTVDAPTRHPDDMPPEPGRRGIPRGLLWALALAVVVLTVASWVALSKGGPADDADVVHIDPNQPTAPSGGDGGLGGGSDISGRPAPTTSFTAFDGTHVSLADLAGTPIVLNFWASNCTSCITEMPTLEQAHQRYGDRVRFVGLDTAEGEALGRAFADQRKVSYTLGSDPSGDIFKSFGASLLPTTVLIDRTGKVVYDQAKVFGSADEVSALIEAKLQP